MAGNKNYLLQLNLKNSIKTISNKSFKNHKINIKISFKIKKN
jgi:hypothetical protein